MGSTGSTAPITVQLKNISARKCQCKNWTGRKFKKSIQEKIYIQERIYSLGRKLNNSFKWLGTWDITFLLNKKKFNTSTHEKAGLQNNDSAYHFFAKSRTFAENLRPLSLHSQKGFELFCRLGEKGTTQPLLLPHNNTQRTLLSFTYHCSRAC